MRKSKLITIFDVRVVMDWTGKTICSVYVGSIGLYCPTRKATHSNGAKATGSLTIPEVSHDVVIDGLEDYVVSYPTFYLWIPERNTDGGTSMTGS